ncbi:PaaI family thioesterase [Candidatus Halocynthiibacter alkanivorans]|uniref:PaaI family thioesterase n=1 Tax=Candidatus Halocynthiibacter alkanivorans TaxID=2267619 RepID=UPI001F258F74|nr:PaaI family thioesterase [Candidatus Halocynthiibacter alkanivorans]
MNNITSAPRRMFDAPAFDFHSRSGLDFMQTMLRDTSYRPPIGDTLNFTLVAVDEDRVEFHGMPLQAHTNPMGGTHGGWYGAVLDSCMSCAVMTRVPAGHIYTTLEYKVSLVRAIPPETRVAAVGIVQHAGRSTGIASGEVRGIEDGKLYASGTATCLIMKAPPQ